MANGRAVPASKPVQSPSTPADMPVVLGGVEYIIRPLPIRAEQLWLEAADTPINAILDMMAGSITVELNNLAQVIDVVRAMKHTMFTASLTLLDLVCLYSQEIAEDRERIENEAYTLEIVDAFVQIVSVVFPLDKVRKALPGFTRRLT